MTYKDVEEVLAHFGVKGMRWGVRRDRKKAVRRRADNAKNLERDQKVAAEKGVSLNAARQMRRTKTQAKRNAVLLSAGAVAFALGRDMALSLIVEGYSGAPTTRLLRTVGRTTMSAARSSARGSRMLFENDVTVFAPGTIRPGTYESAAVIREALPAVRRALNA